MHTLNLSAIHSSWLPIVRTALAQMDPHYIEQLNKNPNWLPGPEKALNAFSLPLNKVRYILFGESPYPRQESANGYAFWDAKVDGLWSPKGLSKTVNRATSLRNIIKMLLVARQELSEDDTSQDSIASLDKSQLIQEIDDLFMNMQKQGILLLNASLVLSSHPVKQDARAWQPFMASILEQLSNPKYKDITLILMGKIANAIQAFPAASQFKQFNSEHPYNISFITNPKIIEFFSPMDLLAR